MGQVGRYLAITGVFVSTAMVTVSICPCESRYLSAPVRAAWKVVCALLMRAFFLARSVSEVGHAMFPLGQNLHQQWATLAPDGGQSGNMGRSKRGKGNGKSCLCQRLCPGLLFASVVVAFAAQSFEFATC